MAARVGFSPAMPTTAVTTVSALARLAASSRPPSPPATRVGVSASRRRRSAAADSSAAATSSGRNCRACASASSTLWLTVRAATRWPQLSATSRVCRPMEPVEPKIEMDRFMFIPQNTGRHSIMKSTTGPQKIMESNRSSIPPWPGSR